MSDDLEKVDDKKYNIDMRHKNIKRICLTLVVIVSIVAYTTCLYLGLSVPGGLFFAFWLVLISMS